MSSSGSLLSFLTSELGILASETRRKHPEVKAAADEALGQLKNIKEGPGVNVPQLLAEEVDVLNVLMLAGECAASSRLMSHLVTVLHRLISHAALLGTEAQISIVLGILDRTAGLADEVQLRGLQCVMPLLTHYTCHGVNLFRAYAVCFRMQAARSPTVFNAAVAIIRQLVIWLFERVVEEELEPSENVTLIEVARDDGSCIALRPFAADAYVILQDVCLLVNDEMALVLNLPQATLNKSFGLELIESVLSYNSRVFQRQAPFARLVQDKLYPMALKRLSERAEFAQTCRLWRVVALLIRDFNDILPAETEVLLSFVIRLVEESPVTWERALLLETAKDWLANLQLVKAFSIIGTGVKLLSDLSKAICNVLIGLAVKLQNVDLVFSTTALKVPLLQQFDKNSPPMVSDAYVLLVAFDTISGFLAGLSELCLPDSTESETIKGENDDNRISKNLLDSLWGSLLKAHICLLDGCRVDDEWRTRMLNSFSNLIKLTAILSLREALGATLGALVEIALPQYQQAERPGSGLGGSLVITDLNLAASTTILGLALSLAELLNETWGGVFHVMHATDQFSAAKARKFPMGEVVIRRGSSQIPIGILPPSIATMYLNQVIELSQGIIDHSRKLSLPAFNFFLKALCQLGLSTITNTPNNLKAAVIYFPAQKLKQVALLNIFRFIEFDTNELKEAWDMLSTQLILIMSCGDTDLRGLGCETALLITTQFASTVQTNVFTNSSSLQERLLEPLERMVAVPSVDGVKTALEALQRVLQHLGPQLSSSGWPGVFRILSAALLKAENTSGLTRCAFPSVKLICAEFLGNLDRDSLWQEISLLSRFARLTEELNISLTAIGLLWDVADHVRTHPTSSNDSLWALILTQLVKLTGDSRPEIRNSAVQTTTRAIEIGGASLSENQWMVVLEDTILPLLQQARQQTRKMSFDNTNSSATRIDANNCPCDDAGDGGNKVPMISYQLEGKSSIPTHHSRNTEEKQWNETRLLVLQGVTQIYCHFLPILITLKGFAEEYWAKLLDLISEYCELGSSEELVSESISCLSKLAQISIGSGRTDRLYQSPPNGVINQPTNTIENQVSGNSQSPKDSINDREEFKSSLATKANNDLDDYNGTTGSKRTGSFLTVSLFQNVWKTWCHVGACMRLDSLAFTQETLLRFVRTFPALLARLHDQVDATWLGCSFGVLDQALRCPTPSDHIRDVDSLTELQKNVVELLDETVEYEANHQARALYLRQLAGWLNWLRELDDVEMTLTFSQRRSRVGTNTSASSVTQRTNRTGIATHVALSMAALERIKKRTVTWAHDQSLYKDGAVKVVVEALGRLATLKYRAPAGSGPVALWKLATKALNMVILATLPGVESIEGDSDELWETTVGLMEGLLERARTQVPVELALDQLDADEEFDTSQVMFIRDSLLCLMTHVDPILIRRLLMAIEISSHLYINPIDSEEDETPSFPSGGLIQVQPVIKERFAITCLHSLFIICADHNNSTVEEARSEPGRHLRSTGHLGPDLPGVTLPECIRVACLPVLLQRCQSVIVRYTTDKALLGRMPFPRVRQDEMLYVLQELNSLRLTPSPSQSGSSLSLSLYISEESLPGIPPRDGSIQGIGGIDQSNPVRRTLLTGPIGHLFYLYPQYCECLRLDDQPVLALVQRTFALMGMELGLFY